MVLGVDRDPQVRDTFLQNNINFNKVRPRLLVEDIDLLAPSRVARLLRESNPQGRRPRPLLFIGCPPCQPFTNIKTNKARSLSDRGALHRFLDLVGAIRPDYVVVENVPGIRSAKYGDLWSNAIHRLEDMGYGGICERNVNAKHFGVPQTRLRALLVASRRGPAPWPEATHHEGNLVTVAKVIRRLQPLVAGEKSRRDKLHVASELSPLNLKRVRAIREPGGSRTCWPPHLQLACYRGHEGHTDVYGRMAWDNPAPTLTTRFVSLSNGRFGHPEQNRAITPREGALLQTFPRRYKFITQSRDSTVRLIGNAVPPRLAEVVVRAIIRHAAGEAD